MVAVAIEPFPVILVSVNSGKTANEVRSREAKVGFKHCT